MPEPQSVSISEPPRLRVYEKARQMPLATMISDSLFYLQTFIILNPNSLQKWMAAEILPGPKLNLVLSTKKEAFAKLKLLM